jgi:hypothetical protein
MKIAWLLTVLCGASLTPQPAAASPSPARGWSQTQFLITFWCPPPATDEALSRVASEGFNLTWTPPDGLDAAHRHGLRVMLQSDLLTPDVLDNGAKRAELDALVDRVKTHPALEAYYLTDEPGAGAFAALGRLVAYLRERDPVHLAYINLFPTYANEQQLGVSANAADRARVGYPQNFAGVGADDGTVLRYREHLKRFVETVKPDLISYDHYHFLKPDKDGRNVDGGQYFLNLALIRMAAMEARKPFLNIIQANTIEKSWRLPNAWEMRFLVFTTLAYGGRGISYFTYWGPTNYGGLYQDGKPSALLIPVAELNREIAKFGPALMKLDSTAVYHTGSLPCGTQPIPPDAPVQIVSPGDFVLGLFGNSGVTTAFMIVNRDYSSESRGSVKFASPGVIVEELDRRTGKWSKGERPGRDGLLQVQLNPGDGRLFRITRLPRVSGEDQRGATQLLRHR